jgi:predicted nucleic acid-binding protein
MPEVVISDTSPIQYLYQAGCLDLLPQLYGAVTIPEGVAAELSVGQARGVSLPDLEGLTWIEIQPAPHLGILPLAADLGPGEREVLSLAVGRAGALALLDDGLARQFARFLKVPFTGTIGILLKAKEKGLLMAVRPILNNLESLGFWLDAATKRVVLDLAREG